jgi:NADPH:quinone reductase-like Zn-dependent oxidoreductase
MQGIVAPDSYPKILGGDLAGEVAEADEGSKFKKGDRVAALTYGGCAVGPAVKSTCNRFVQ